MKKKSRSILVKVHKNFSRSN